MCLALVCTCDPRTTAQENLAPCKTSFQNRSMTFTDQQIDEWVRLFGTLAAAALSGAAVGVVRPDQISKIETFGMLISACALICMIMFWRRKP